MPSHGYLKFKIILTSVSKEIVSRDSVITELDFPHGFRAPTQDRESLIFVTFIMLVNQLFRDRGFHHLVK